MFGFVAASSVFKREYIYIHKHICYVYLPKKVEIITKCSTHS